MGPAGPAALPGDIPSNYVTLDGTTQTTVADAAGAMFGTEQSASGSEVDFTNIPSGTRKIELIFYDLESNTNHFLVQIGDAGGFEQSGYESGSEDSGARVNSTTGFIVRKDSNRFAHDRLVLTNIGGNRWVSDHTIMVTASPNMSMGGGVKTLSDELDRVRIDANGGSFNNGFVNIRYE
jgi:hypothetical protein